MPKSPAFQFYAAEYLADEDVQLMSLEEEGCYIRLLAYCWREGSIPSDLDKLSRLCKGASTTAVRVVTGCFKQDATDSTRLLHKRLEVEREKQRQWREKSSRGGLKSAEVRANKESPTVEPPLQPPLQPNSNTASSSSSSVDTTTTTKTSRAKTTREKPTKTELVKTRHDTFKGKIKQYWEYKNPGVEMPWGPAEGRQLAMWLAESPQTSVEQFTEFLRNRARSEGVNHAERPSRWIGNVTSYAKGPLNTFKQPLNGTRSSGGKTNGHVVEGNCETLKTALASLGCPDHGENNGDGLFSSSADQPGLPEIYVGPLIEGKS